MRLDDLPQSDNVEDRRGDGGGGGGGGGGFPIGGGGLGIGTIVVLGMVGWALGIDPRLLIGGAEMLTGGRPAVSRRPQQAVRARPARRATRWASSSRAVLGSTEVQWKEIFEQGRPDLPRADARDVLRRDARRACGTAQSAMGPFYCPTDQQDLSRHLVLPRSRAALPRLRRGRGLPVRAGLRDRARGRPSRAEPARHSAEGAAGAARRRQQGRGEPHPGAGRAAGRLLRRRLGQPRRAAMEAASSRATSRPRCRPRPRSATTRCRSRRRATSCRTASPTARRSSASAGSRPASRQGTVAACNTFARGVAQLLDRR